MRYQGVELRLKERSVRGTHHGAVAHRALGTERCARGRKHIAISVKMHDRTGAWRDQAYPAIVGALGIVRHRAAGEVAVAAVAKRRAAGMLAAAEDDLLVALGLEGDGCKSRPRVRAVAKGLLLRPTTAAPEVALARLQPEIKSLAVSNLRLGAVHRVCPGPPLGLRTPAVCMLRLSRRIKANAARTSRGDIPARRRFSRRRTTTFSVSNKARPVSVR